MEGGRWGGRWGGKGGKGGKGARGGGAGGIATASVVSQPRIGSSCQLAIDHSEQRGRVGSKERGQAGPPPCCPRGLVLFCRQAGHTHALPHTYSALHTHLFTLNSTENRQTRTPPPGRASAISVGYPVPNPGGARPGRHLDPPGGLTTYPAHDADATLHRAHGACPHAHPAQAPGPPSLTRGRYTHKL